MEKNFFSWQELVKRFGLSKHARFLGYVVHLPELEVFLASSEASDELNSRIFVGRPELAKRYENHKEAIKDASLCNQKAVVCLLIDEKENYLIAPCED